MKTVLGMACIDAGKYDRADEVLRQSIDLLGNGQPNNWGALARSYLALGHLERKQHDLDTAESLSFEAQNAWLKGDQLRTAPFNGACMYKLGCIALDQGKIEAAIKHLRDALDVTEKLMTIFTGEYIRVLL